MFLKWWPAEPTAVVQNPDVARSRLSGFVEANGYVSMEADHFSSAVNSGSVSWRRIPDIGRTGAGMEAFPVTASSQTPGGNGRPADQLPGTAGEPSSRAGLTAAP
jgi:Gylcosyl hydrolase family 115 C-terminal domain